jgi:hypothetical protein
VRDARRKSVAAAAAAVPKRPRVFRVVAERSDVEVPSPVDGSVLTVTVVVVLAFGGWP